jgi:hypothetical protein
MDNEENDKSMSGGYTGGYAFGGSPFTVSGGYDDDGDDGGYAGNYEGGSVMFSLAAGQRYVALLEGLFIMLLLASIYYLYSGDKLPNMVKYSTLLVGSMYFVHELTAQYYGRDVVMANVNNALNKVPIAGPMITGQSANA